MGRKRQELVNIAINSSNVIRDMRGKTMYYNDGITKQRFSVTADEEIQSFIVVISKQNITSSVVERHISNIQANKDLMSTRVYFLTDGIHPNRAVYLGQPENVRILPEFGHFMKDLEKLF